jgi:hypothetical protein
MEQEPGSPCYSSKVWLSLAILFAGLVLLRLATPGEPAVAPIGVSFTLPSSGHMGNFCSSHFVVAFVTNATPWNLNCLNPFLQWDERGTVVVATMWDEGGTTTTVNDNLWGGTNYFCSLGPGQVMPLPVAVPTNSTRFKIKFYYARDAGRVQKLFSFTGGRLLPRSTTPSQTLLRRLWERGWVDGRLHMSYESGWEENR